MDPHDGLSTNICNECMSQLVQCYSFRQKCEKTQNILEEFKLELEKSQPKNLNKSIVNIPSLNSDYQQSSNVATIKNAFQLGNVHKTDINNQDVFKCEAEHNNSGSGARLLFLILKSNINDNKSPDINKNATEMNEKKVILLMQKSAESPQKNASSEENKLANENDTKLINSNVIQSTNIQNDKLSESSILRSCLTTRVRNYDIKMKQAKLRNKSFSEAIQKVMNLTRDGRTQQAKAKNVPKLPLTVDRRRRKEKKNASVKLEQVFPGSCRVCDVPLPSKIEYLEHAKATKHYFIEYTCDVCSKVFPGKHQLIKHKQVHKIKCYMCEKCGLQFRGRCTLKCHMKVHFKNAVESFVCSTCGYVFNNRTDLTKHRRVKHMEKKFCCEFCGRFLINKACLMQHKKRMHMNVKLEKCFICDKEFSKIILKRHLRTHNGEKFKCKLCNCKFKNESKYDYHMKNRHPGADENMTVEDQIKTIDCGYCEEICQNKQSMSIHMSEAHAHLLCKYCDRKFQTDSELSTHYITHSNIVDFSCRYCGKTFESWDCLYPHLRTHTPQTIIRNSLRAESKSYPCQYCNRSFIYKQSVIIHERIHTGERPYVCDLCGRRTLCTSSLKKHKRTHFLQNGQKII